MSVSDHRRQVAKFLAARLGGKVSVRSHLTRDGQRELGVLRAEGSPVASVNSYATVGLSEHPLMVAGNEYPARVEFLGACRKDFTKFDEVISTAAFTVINSLGFVAPGTIIEDGFRTFQPRGNIRHLYCSPPTLWDPEIPTTMFGALTVAWILLVPISDNEAGYAAKAGPDALATLLEDHAVDITDPSRPEVAPSTASKARRRTVHATKEQRPKGAESSHGRCSIAPHWSIALPAEFTRRSENDAIVLSRPGFTIWATLVDDGADASVSERLARLRGKASERRFDEHVDSESPLPRLDYRLSEGSTDAKAPALYGFIIAPRESLMVAFYFDHEEDAAVARRLLATIEWKAPE